MKSRWHFSLFPTQIQFEDRKKQGIGNNCLLSIDGTDFHIAMGWSKNFYSFKFNRLDFDTRLVFASKREKFAGGVGRIHLGYEMIFQFSETGGWHTWSLGSRLRWIEVTVAVCLNMLNAHWRWQKLELTGDRQWTVWELGNTMHLVPSQFFWTPNSFWCCCRAYPAFSCSKPFVSCKIQW